QRVALLALLNCAPPNSRYSQTRLTPLWAGRFVRNLFYLGNYFCHWTPPQRREFFRWKWGALKTKLAGLCRGGSGTPCGQQAANLVDLSSFSADERKVWEAHIKALLKYHPRVYDGPVHLIRS